MKARIATADDCALLAEMNHHLIRDEGHRNPMTVDELAERMKGWLTGGEYHAVLFEQDNHPLAYALYRSEGGSSVYLRQFFVARDHRRKGLGRAAIKMLLGEVLPRNCRVTLEVLCHNEAGKRFWAAAGFQNYALTLEQFTPSSAPPLQP